MWQKEQVIDELQKRGKRITEQRNMLLDVIYAGTGLPARIFITRPQRPGLGLYRLPDPVGALEETASCTAYQYSFLPGER